MKKQRTKSSSVHTPTTQYAVYKGDDLLIMGSLQECADELNVKPDTIKFYATASYRNRRARSKNPEQRRIAEIVEEDE